MRFTALYQVAIIHIVVCQLKSTLYGFSEAFQSDEKGESTDSPIPE